MERWYRQDLERWPETHGHAPVTDRDFWFTIDGTTPTGRGVPFEHAEWELAQHLYHSTVSSVTRQNVGGALMIYGTALLIPGPFDAMAAGIGMAAAGGHPAGAVAGVVAYNLVGLSMVVVGAYLVGESIDFPSMPDVHWDRLQMPRLGATPVVWGVPDYLEI